MISSDAVFSRAERDALGALAEIMIPGTADMPAASDALIMGNTLARLASHRDLVSGALEELDSYAVQETGCSLAELDPERRGGVVEKSDRLDFIGMFQTAVLAAYYQDDRVMVAIGLEPRPAWPEGYAVPATDWSMLEPVRRRGPIWRDAPKDSSG